MNFNQKSLPYSTCQSMYVTSLVMNYIHILEVRVYHKDNNDGSIVYK